MLLERSTRLLSTALIRSLNSIRRAQMPIVLLIRAESTFIPVLRAQNLEVIIGIPQMMLQILGQVRFRRVANSDDVCTLAKTMTC